jgi:hypothetical protein
VKEMCFVKKKKVANGKSSRVSLTCNLIHESISLAWRAHNDLVGTRPKVVHELSPWLC